MIKEIKSELIKFLSALKSEKFEDAPTELAEDAVKISERVVGGKVELVGEGGELTDAPDGSYKLGDFIFTVKAGVIDSIEGEAPVEDKAAEELDEDVPVVEDNSIQEAITALQAETESLKKDIEEIKALLAGFAGKSDVAEFTKEVATLNETILKLAKIPVEISKTNFSEVNKEMKEEKMNDLLRVFAK